ncbi:MAG: family 4 glycosyl hydrolase [Anaerolineae bacterium]
MVKMVLIGGGSPFTPSIFQAITENAEVLDGSEVFLFDIKDTRLDQMKKVGEALTSRAGMKVTVNTGTDVRAAFDGADFVFPGYRVGGMEAYRQDNVIPTRHGICGDETMGPGGTFMAQCTIPATVAYARLMEEVCPEAWAISYVNPTNMVAEGVLRSTKAKFIAVCDCWPGFREQLCHMLEVEDRDLTARAMGVNHLTWLTEVKIKGQDAYPLLREKAMMRRPAGESPDEWTFAMRHLDTYGYMLVCSGHPQMLWEHDASMNERRDRWEDPGIGGWFDRIGNHWKFIDEMIAGAPYDEKRQWLRMHHPRHAIGIAVSIVANEGREWGGMNYWNRGSISNLPDDAVVEGTCIVGAGGPVPLAMGLLPRPFVGLAMHNITWQHLTVDAALSGDKKVLYQAILASPYVHDMKAARQIMEELLVAHADLMPQFK